MTASHARAHVFHGCVSIRFEAGIADVRLARPGRRNALDNAMFAGLAEACAEVSASDARVVVLSGEGEVFCAGLDRSMFADIHDRKPLTGVVGNLVPRSHGDCNLAQHVALGWRDLSIPVIAAIHGAALGGGLQLALGADLRIVSPDAKLALLEMRWGLVPDMAAFVLLPECVRDDVMRELIYTAREVSGEEAVGIGLATRVSADPFALAMSIAAGIAASSPSAIRSAKRLAAIKGGDRSHILLAESNEQDELIGGADQLDILASLTAGA